jgi:hypothetical protein
MTVLKGKHTAEKRPKIAFKKACAEVFLNGDIIELFFAFKEQPYHFTLLGFRETKVGEIHDLSAVTH